jgi:hypothetical protein
MEIRKLSVGSDLKGGALHYIVGQKVLDGSNEIHLIKIDATRNSIQIYIINEKHEIVLWKEFNGNMPISIEYNIYF